MAKRIQVIDLGSGEVELEQEVRGGYCLQYSKEEDTGSLHIAGQIQNGRFDHRYWNKNGIYQDIVQKIINAHKELLERINPARILFLEDYVYEAPDESRMKDAFVITKAPKGYTQLWGYHYVVKSLNYWVERISDENLVAQLYRCLRRIDGMGGLKDYEIVDFKELYEQFGADYLTHPRRQVADILGEGFEWDNLPNPREQMNIYDLEREKRKREAKELELAGRK